MPLGQLAEVRSAEGPVQISRESGERRIGVECNISGRDLGGFVAEARRAIGRNVKLPPGYYLTWGGQFENQQRAMRRLAVILPVTIGFILFLLFVTFDSLRLAALVILNLPFALIGGVLSLYIAGLYLSVPASVGFIALFGIAVLNGIVLLSYITQLREEGHARAGGDPAGMFEPAPAGPDDGDDHDLQPRAAPLRHGPGSEVQRPLAVVVVGGLVTSTLMTLLVLPALYAGLGSKKARPGDSRPQAEEYVS